MSSCLEIASKGSRRVRSAATVVRQVRRPHKIDFVLAPGFQLLSLSAALEPLRQANSIAGEILFDWQLKSTSEASVTCAEGWPIPVHGLWDRSSGPDLTLVCVDDTVGKQPKPDFTGHLRWLWRNGKSVGTIGLGVHWLAEAGLLSGHQFVVHWEQRALFEEFWPDLKPTCEAFCNDRRILTCPGGLTSADLMLDLVQNLSGTSLNNRLLDKCLIRSTRARGEAQTSCVASRIGGRSPKLIRAVEVLERDFPHADCMERCLNDSGLSKRQLQRQFKEHLGQTPVEYLVAQRLAHARRLLAETDLQVTDIAMACGYEATDHFSRSFRKLFGVAPRHYAQSSKLG